jgi:Histidine kinase-, DNA gyrase B-, and HSP90-like ATPase
VKFFGNAIRPDESILSVRRRTLSNSRALHGCSRCPIQVGPLGQSSFDWARSALDRAFFIGTCGLAGKNDPQMAPLDVNNVVGEIIGLLQRELVAHQVMLQLELAPALPAVLSDRVQLPAVLINLVMNGIDAMQPVTDRARELVIRSHQDDALQVLVVMVRDSGFGISVEDADRLFTAFFATQSGGMGLGLSICGSIIEAHGGRLWGSRNMGPLRRFNLPWRRMSRLRHKPADPLACCRAQPDSKTPASCLRTAPPCWARALGLGRAAPRALGLGVDRLRASAPAPVRAGRASCRRTT